MMAMLPCLFLTGHVVNPIINLELRIDIPKILKSAIAFRISGTAFSWRLEVLLNLIKIFKQSIDIRDISISPIYYMPKKYLDSAYRKYIGNV